MFDTTTYIYLSHDIYIYIYTKMYNLKNVCMLNIRELSASRDITLDLPDSTVDKNPPANPGDMDSIPGSRRFYMPRSN